MNISRTLSLIFLVTIECVCSQIVFLFPKRKKDYSCLYLPFAYPNQRFGWRILAYQPQFPVHIFQKEACHKGGCGTCFLGWSQMTVTVSVALRRTQRQSGGEIDDANGSALRYFRVYLEARIIHAIVSSQTLCSTITVKVFSEAYVPE